MGSAMVGMAMHGGVLPAGGTFFVFLDYMRPPVRLAALSRRQGRVRVHPRLGRRRRGRPHPPAGRARRHAAGHPRPAGHPPGRRQRDRRPRGGPPSSTTGPTALVLSPPGHPGPHRRHRPSSAAPASCAPSTDPQLVLVATGSEVALCVDAAERSAAEGIAASVVSLPVVGPLRAPGPPTYRAVAASRRRARAVGRGRHHVRLGALRRRHHRHRPLRRQRTRRTSCSTRSASTSTTSSAPRHQLLVEHLTRPQKGDLAWTVSLRLYHEFGQSPWLDNLKRGYLTSGQLRRPGRRRHPRPHLQPDHLPEGHPGLGRLRRAVPRARRATTGPIVDDYWAMVLHDINGALDVFAPLYDESYGGDGFVSVEVDPGLAHDAAGTEAAARALHEQIARPNLMVKIPATAEGVPAIRQMIAEGRNINVTLIFSLERYQRGDGGLPRRARGVRRAPRRRPGQGRQRGQLLHQPRRHRGRPPARRDRHARGARRCAARRAVAQGKLAYQLFRSTFSGPRWEALADRRRRGAAAAVGQHVDQEPGLPRHAVRRRADRARHRQHAARRHHRGVRRPRHAGPHASTPTSTRPRPRGQA